MLSSKGGKKKANDTGLVAVAIDKDKNSQYAIRWAMDHLLGRGRPVILIHVIKGPSSFSVGSSAVISTESPGTSPNYQNVDKPARDLFLTFRCYCKRKDIRCIDVTLKNADIARALTEYANYAAIEFLVLGASKTGIKTGIIKTLKQTDKPKVVSREAPDFCTVYVVSKSKASTVKKATRPVPHTSPLQSHIESIVSSNIAPVVGTPPRSSVSSNKGDITPLKSPNISFRTQREDRDLGRSDRFNDKLTFSNHPEVDTDISFVSSDRTSVDLLSPVHYDYNDLLRTPRMSTSSERSFESFHSGQRSSDASSYHDFSFVSQESARTSTTSHNNDDEMKRLQLELKQTMEMYNEACKEAVLAREKERKQAAELRQWKLEDGKKHKETGTLEESATALAERKRAEMSAILGEQRRLRAQKEEEEVSTQYVGRYRKYSIKEIEIATKSFSESVKIGEGGYGPVFKCNLDHTRVAVKVLRPDAAQGKAQFQQEVEILSSIRHPNLVLLLGACPEYGCLVYEYMTNGCLDSRLFCRGNTPPLGWAIRFRIAADIATGLHFLHQTKPEPLVHRDLKPGNILLDRYFVSKIGDVGLARLVPPSVADQITQYCMTSAAGTFCYIDPEYQQTGLLGVKSDVYSFGIVLLQLLTAKKPMGLAHQVDYHISNGTFSETLDPSVPDWPVEEALSMAKIAVQCAQLRRKDRPDLGQVLPELDRLRDFADDTMQPLMFYASGNHSSVHSHVSISQATISNPSGHSTASSSQVHSTASSFAAVLLSSSLTFYRNCRWNRINNAGQLAKFDATRNSVRNDQLNQLI